MFSKLKYKIITEPHLIEKIYRLRYEVYVEELKFISPHKCKKAKEIDKFDLTAMHIGAIDETGEICGSVRLVPDSEFGFPLEEHCYYPLIENYIGLNRKRIVEISRLVISKKYRLNNTNNFSHRRLTPLLFEMYSVAYRESLRLGIAHWIAAMEESLFKLVGSQGFMFRQIGEPIEYFGKVVPYLGDLETIADIVNPTQKINCSELITI